MNFKEFTILDTYSYYDGPLIFSTRIDEKLFLAYSWGSDRNEYMFFETSQKNLKLFEEDSLSIRNFFRKCSDKQAYRVTFSREKDPVVEPVSSDKIEEEAYVKEDIYLERDDAL